MLVRTYSMSQAVAVGYPKSGVRKDKQLACQSPKRDSFCGFQMKKARLEQENAARKPQGFAHGLERPEVAARANDAVVLS